ncbi:rhomboid family intramembrane serine protease [Natrialbaceae archaeon A-arb3/5]
MLSVALACFIIAITIVSFVVVGRLDGSIRRWHNAARDRLVLGVPWGTIVVILFVGCVYLFVQDGISDLSDPVTIPYRAWSYFSPLGMAASSFSHAHLGHLVGNLLATVVVAPIAEYAWGHYPGGRDGENRSDDSWRANPWVRALVIFPLAVIAIGLATSLFSLGPVIGFSGIVFAFAGFAIVRYPIATLVATIGVQSALATVYSAARTPIYVYVAEASAPSAPSWANIAIQGHALGFFIGLVLGLLLLERRGTRPSAARIWLAVLLYAFSKGLWQIYWFGEGNAYYLFQGPGVVIIATLALVITLAVAASERRLVPARFDPFVDRSRSSDAGDADAGESPANRPLELANGGWDVSDGESSLDRIRELTVGGRPTERSWLSSVTQRSAAFVAVLLVLALLAGMAVPVNLFVLDDDRDVASDRGAIEIEEYTIEYAEDVENQLASGFGLDELDDGTGLTESGVIVSSEQRHIWIEAVSADQLAFSGSESVSVGGPGWRETVHAERAGWEPVGNDTVYQVWLWADGDEPQHVYESASSQADVRIDNRTVTIAPDDGEFVLEVESTETDAVSTTPVPDSGETTTVDDLTVENDDETLYVASNGTAVAVADEETYR